MYKSRTVSIDSFHGFNSHLELHRVDEASTLVALVPAGLWVRAVGADPFDKAVGEEALAGFATQLLHRVFQQETVLVQAPENILGDPVGDYRRVDTVEGFKGKKNKQTGFATVLLDENRIQGKTCSPII